MGESWSGGDVKRRPILSSALARKHKRKRDMPKL